MNHEIAYELPADVTFERHPSMRQMYRPPTDALKKYERCFPNGRVREEEICRFAFRWKESRSNYRYIREEETLQFSKGEFRRTGILSRGSGSRFSNGTRNASQDVALR